MKEKTYIIEGVAQFAHVMSIKVSAKSRKEAIQKAKQELSDNAEKYVNIQMAEYIDCKLDKPEEVED